MNSIYRINFFSIFIIYVVLSLSVNIIEQVYIATNDRIITSFSDHPQIGRIQKDLESRHEISVLDSFIFAVKIIVGFYLIVLAFFISAQINKYKINFQDLSKVILLGHGAFLLAYVTKVGIFLITPDFTLIDYRSYYPLSLMSLFDVSEVDRWIIDLLQAINLFQIFFAGIVAYGLIRFVRIDIGNSLIWSSTTHIITIIGFATVVAFVQIMIL